MRPKMLYFISDEQGQTYSNDANGNLISTPDKQPVGNTPDGWQDMAIKYGRNENYYGIIRSYTVPLGFKKLGARIIRQLYYGVKGIQAQAILTIARYVPLLANYTLLYSSDLNFSTLEDTDEEAGVSTTDGDLSAMIAANEGTEYEIPVEVPEALDVFIDGIELYSVVKVINYADALSTSFIRSNIFFGNIVTDTETKYISTIWNSQTDYYASDSLPYEEEQWLFKVNDNATLRFQADSFKVNIAGATSYRLFLLLVDPAGATRQVDIVPSTPTTGFPQDLDLSFDVSINVLQGETGYLVFTNGGGGGGKTTYFTQDNTINITYNYRAPGTFVKCLRPDYVYNQLISKISSGKYTGSALNIGAIMADTVMTCGDALRGFKAGDSEGYTGPKIKTSLRDFFKSYNARFNLGQSIESNVAILAPKSNFYRAGQVTGSVGEVSDHTLTPALDYIYSSIKVGWPEQTYDDINGREEFNTTQTYTTPIDRHSNVYDVVSVYRADCYGIEFTRINLDGKSTTDSDSDNDNFLINISHNGTSFIVNRPAGSVVSGVKGGLTTFNWLLSPKYCLYAHGSWIKSALDKQEDGQIVFTTSDKNQAFQSTINGVTMVESANVNVSDLPGNKVYLPHLVEFTCRVPENIVDLMEVNPFGEIFYMLDGVTYSGFIIEASQQTADNPQQTFQLLLGPGNNLLNRIR